MSDIRSGDPSIRGIILTSYDDDEALFAAIMAGASGYVLNRSADRPRRRRPPGRRRPVAAGPGRHHPGARPAPHADDAPAELAQLTEREREILELIAEGLTNREIGERLFLAEKTVKNYVSSLLAKLGLERGPRRPCSRRSCWADPDGGAQGPSSRRVPTAGPAVIHRTSVG